MNRISFYRVLQNGLLNYWRNFWLSLAATAIMVITLFIMSSLFVIHILTDLSLSTIQEKVDISVYFQLGVSETVIDQIKTQAEKLSEVKSITYIPSVTARERFKELHKDEPLLIESVEQFTDAENPFPASLAIRVANFEDYPKIINLFQDEKFNPFIKKITDKRDIVDRLNRITTGIRNFGFVMILIFSIITIIVMFNTIRLTIYNRREEIEIMRLVGASNWFIRGPFIVEGIFYGVSGAIITAVILYPVLLALEPRISSFLEVDISQYNFLKSDFLILFATQIVAGIGLGVLSSLIVIRRYLKI